MLKNTFIEIFLYFCCKIVQYPTFLRYNTAFTGMTQEIQDILDFLKNLKENNNREWFAQHKPLYEQTRTHFERVSQTLIQNIGYFDPEVRHLNVNDCIFRIYRDTRFSLDKTPYKTHYGIFIASGGGRKSVRSGYYFHIEPDGCFLSTGVWCPPPHLLKALRRAIFENMDEFLQIIEHPDFKQYYNGFYAEDALKSIPKGFPKEGDGLELLKLKHYMVQYNIANSALFRSDLMEHLALVAHAAFPMHTFLNYIVDETPVTVR